MTLQPPAPDPDDAYGPLHTRSAASELTPDLRAIAEAATKGPWKVGNEDGDLDHYWRGGGSVVATADRKDLITFCHQWRENRENDATFIATFNPAQALSLLDLLAAQAARIEELEGAARLACDLLAERTHGSSARSPGHNARLELEAVLTAQQKGDVG